MIRKAIDNFRKIFIPDSEFGNDRVDDSWTKKNDAETFTADAKRHYESYIGVPAPVISPSDGWFNEPVVTEKGQDYMVQETEFKRQEMEKVEKRKASGEFVEPDNIHEVMYQMSTKSAATTLQLDPIGGSENFQGGSENYHER
jgi:hypothetical protein